MALSYSDRTVAAAGPGPAGPPPNPPPVPTAGGPGEPTAESLGDLISDITDDVGRLVRSEIELAKAELKQEAGKAGKASGMLAGAGYAGHLVLLLGSLTLVFALGNVMNLAWAALLVTAVWAIVGALLYTAGRRRLKEVRLAPEQTLETLKEDAAWARHPTS
ncbi:phage holin family protein [Kitasatospora sp. A2-31]|uniref:phage holin family protein n=1 Tax=Kitasatospora sp. A2-31 TaxID=2916414 RepID=UPI001EEC130B|nr:phage holin family protein [Kitasatospora sp. A2-31]MCG6494313.1 phage holin family protein [Kitasatospora sp. A2-31]